MTGADVVAGVAMGARAALVGRAYLYGLMAGGERGVAASRRDPPHELVRTMQLLGVPRSPSSAPSGSGSATRASVSPPPRRAA